MSLRGSLFLGFFLFFTHAGLAVNPTLINTEAAISATQGPYYPSRPPMNKRSEQLVVNQEGCPNLNLFLQTFYQFGTLTISSAPTETVEGDFFVTYDDGPFTKACQYPVDVRYHMVIRILNKTSSLMADSHVDKDVYGRITGSFSATTNGVTTASINLAIDPQTQNIALPLPNWNSAAHVLFNVDVTMASTLFAYNPIGNLAYFYAGLSVFID